MIESPLIKKIEAESAQKAMQESILEFLEARFGAVPEEISEALRKVRARKKLKDLVKHAARSSDLEAFRRRL
jgi:outer membrane protein assembly factor BamA